MNTDFRIAVGMTGRDIGAGIQAPHAWRGCGPEYPAAPPPRSRH